MNTARIKAGLTRAIRDWNDKHPRDTIKAEKMSRAPFWGKAAKTNFYRLSQHVRGLDYAPRPTQALIDYLFPPSFGELVVRRAKAEVGVKEHPAGSNDGPRVHTYQSSTGAYRQPWCASGRKWLEDRVAAARDLRIKWFDNPAWVPNWTAAFGGKLYMEVSFENARGGDAVTLWGSQHIETVVRRGRGWRRSYLRCIGFNTSPAGQNANGGMVAYTWRHRSEVTKIGRRRGV